MTDVLKKVDRFSFNGRFGTGRLFGSAISLLETASTLRKFGTPTPASGLNVGASSYWQYRYLKVRLDQEINLFTEYLLSSTILHGLLLLLGHKETHAIVAT
jgi:hypothetical protein